MMDYISKKNLVNNRKLIQVCKKADAITLDIFDTTIIRTVDHPTEIFRFVEKRADKLGVKNFFEKRIKAQELAEKKLGKKTTFNDIYYHFMNLYKTDVEVVESLKEYELEEEIRHSLASRAFKELIDFYYEKGIPVYFLSDMYLTQQELKKILKIKGIENYNGIIVSCEYGKTKADSKLYDVIRTVIGEDKKIVHIGDNIRTDFINVLFQKNFSPVLVSTIQGNLEKICTYGSMRTNGILYNWGFCEFGPVMYGFCRWIKKEVEQNKDYSILFLTREGAYIKRLYDKFASCMHHNVGNISGEITQTKLMYISRRSVFGAMADLDWKSVKEYISYTGSSLMDIGEMFQISEDRISQVSVRYGLDKDKELKDIPNKDDILNALRDECSSYSETQRKHLIKYFHTVCPENKAILVDIGWRGSMQFYLQELLEFSGIHVTFKGLYFGEYSADEFQCVKKGYVCQDSNKYAVDSTINASFVFENAMMLDLGTTIRYEESVGAIRPVTANAEKVDTDKIKQIQEGVYDFFSIMKDAGQNIRLDDENVVKKLFQHLNYPNIELASAIGNITWSDVDKIKYVARPDNLCTYISNPKKIISDMRSSGWNTGFLRRLFRLPLPYFNVYEKLRG